MSGIVGQNTLDGSGLIKSPEGGGAWNFIKKLTASGDSSLSFVDGTDDVVLDSTYKTYVFTFNNIHPETDNAEFGFNLSVDGGSNYNVTKTSTPIYALHSESNTEAILAYELGLHLAQATGTQYFQEQLGNDNDHSLSGYLHLFNPSSTTFVKHFIYVGNGAKGANHSTNFFVSGYGNTTSAVNAIEFRPDGGNIDAGDFCLYGISS